MSTKEKIKEEMSKEDKLINEIKNILTSEDAKKQENK